MPDNYYLTDVYIAKGYLLKIKNAKANNNEFTISFNEYRRLIKRKTCYYTGLRFPDYHINNSTDNTRDKWLKHTLDRVDNSLGYVPGNVVACCSGVNHFKSIIEDPDNPLTFKNVKHMLLAIESL